jgi:hypothetical protein
VHLSPLPGWSRTLRYHSVVAKQSDPEVASVLDLLESGGVPSEGELVKLLRRPSCPGAVVERLSLCPWLLSSRRALQLVVRHPRCPRHFAWDALPRLGWHDLLEVARDPRTSPAIRKQSERKLAERLNGLTLGERTALARQAPRSVVGVLLTDEQPLCVEALVANPHFTETEALRLLHGNRNPECVLVLLRHPLWGRRPEVLRAAVRSERIPLGVALGLLALLPESDVEALAASAEVRGHLRAAAALLLRRRRAGPEPDGSAQPS